MELETPKYLQKWLAKPITAIIDTREQCPLNLSRYVPDIVETRSALAHGDYSLEYPAMTLDVCIERKSKDDLVQSIMKDCAVEDETINNFKKTLLAMRGYKYKIVVVEGTIGEVMRGEYHSKINPNSVMGFISYWMGVQGIPFLFAESHAGASYIVAKMLYNIAIREIKLSLLAGRMFPGMSINQLRLLGNVGKDTKEDIVDFYDEVLSANIF